ncbi:MAG: hypothetical protein J6T35_07840 [Bacteroidales bacterium]|nr:hypothetical protein [Bacteroidales bacterium]
MKQEGRKHYNWPRKVDCHPKKGYINWWEDETDCEARNTRKQKMLAEVEKELTN